MFVRPVAPRIELRLFQMRDAAELLEAVERDRAHLREWLPWVDQTRSIDDIRGFIHRVHVQFGANQGPQAALWVEGRIVGSLGCHPIDWANRHCSVGYWMGSAHQGRGIMTRACAVLLDYLFNDLGVHRVTIQCGVGNDRSCAIPERLGFEREGVVRHGQWVNDRWVDLIVFGMLDYEWQRRAGVSG
jgi:ribosomal-protein-serine acetyltransferase